MNLELEHSHGPEFEFLDYRVEDGVAVVTVRRPKALNALSAEVLKELADVPELVAEDTSVRTVVFTGEGERAFIAGADMPRSRRFRTSSSPGSSRFWVRT